MHPCQKLHKDIPEYEVDSDYIDLLNMVQRHTRCCCGTSYCLRKAWCAKCDIQLVIDHYACVEYLTKYAAKGKPRSALLKQTFNSIVQNIDNNSDPHRAIKKDFNENSG